MAKERRIQQQPFSGKTAIVCGGSKGIGKATAKEIALLGGSVCIVARGPETLQSAAEEIRGLVRSNGQFVETISCDTTDMPRLKPLFEAFIEQRGVPDYLINLVGYSRPKYVQELTLEDFRQNMEVNYCGQLVPTLVLLPHFLETGRGHIAYVSSMGGFLGLMGYAAYTPTKFALVGLAEALRHELKPYHIDLSVLFPPDTDTPGFEVENRTKPQEWAMSGLPKLFSPERIAQDLLEGLLKKRFEILPGMAKPWRVLFRLFPSLIRKVSDIEYARLRKKLGKA